MKVHVKRGDLVKVISGNDAGRQGKVLEVHPKTNRVVVDGINIKKKHTRPSQGNSQGGIIDLPGPMNASNVALVCQRCDGPVRVARERSEDGSLTRKCKKCGRAID